MQLILATNNLHKILELKAILKPLLKKVDLLSLRDFPEYRPSEETGSTFLENAETKALNCAKALKSFVLADDSGLIIPALGGEPGIYSRRYAGEEASDKENREKLIEKLKTLPDHERTGYYECALCFANEEGVIKSSIGHSEGRLILEPKGGGGFGYDSIFLKYDYNKTIAELNEDTKNRISHRRKALDKLLLTIEAELSVTIIDGYNLFFRLAEIPNPLQTKRESFIIALSQALVDANVKAIVVFDSSQKESHDYPSTSFAHENMEILFSPKGLSADDYLLEYLEVHQSPHYLTLVTDDRRLTLFAKESGVKY